MCVKEPTLEELARAVCLCQLRNIIEPHKAYPRDYFQLGRLKVEVVGESGQALNASVANSRVRPIQRSSCWRRWRWGCSRCGRSEWCNKIL